MVPPVVKLALKAATKLGILDRRLALGLRRMEGRREDDDVLRGFPPSGEGISFRALLERERGDDGGLEQSGVEIPSRFDDVEHEGCDKAGIVIAGVLTVGEGFLSLNQRRQTVSMRRCTDINPIYRLVRKATGKP